MPYVLERADKLWAERSDNSFGTSLPHPPTSYIPGPGVRLHLRRRDRPAEPRRHRHRPDLLRDRLPARRLDVPPLQGGGDRDLRHRPASTRARPTSCCGATPSARSASSASASAHERRAGRESRAGTSAARSALGSALFTLVEPHQGHEVAYNRWYERDHFYAGCMVGPWLFAGRRWVCTRDLKDLRIGGRGAAVRRRPGGLVPGAVLDAQGPVPRQHRLVDPPGALAARQRPHVRRARPHPHAAVPLQRGRGPRRRRRAGRARARPPVPGPRRRGGRAERATAPRAAPAGPRPPAAPVALVLGFRAVPLPPDAPVTQPGTDGVEHRELQLWFADAEPAGWWPAVERYADHGRGVGRRAACGGRRRSSRRCPAPTATPTSSGSHAGHTDHARAEGDASRSAWAAERLALGPRRPRPGSRRTCCSGPSRPARASTPRRGRRRCPPTA